MAFLVDTNVLLRWVQPNHPQNAEARAAVQLLRKRGEAVYITAQNLAEFWVVATRPVDKNGLGMTPGQADAEMRQLEQLFPLLPDNSEVFAQWRRLVVSAGVSGKPAHDARLAAVAHAYGIPNILTFNAGDFKRFGLAVAEPKDVQPPVFWRTTVSIASWPTS